MTDSHDRDNISIVSNADSSSLKEEGIQIDVENLHYSVNIGGIEVPGLPPIQIPGVSNIYTKPLLQDVSFRLRPGSLCALMGPSGSGKRYLFVLGL
jgi:ABC-type multidrug transport system fused ATPase/permease subunit